MQSVTALYGRHRGADLYIVGTGASVRVFPLSFLDDKITIGLNMAWKLLPVTYCITIRPELNVPEFLDGTSRPEIQWITKHGKLRSDEQRAFVEANSERFYNYRTDGQKNTEPEGQPSDAGRIVDWVRKPTGEFLYLWSSIAQSAMNLAANMGARNVIMIGCDNMALLGNHHAHAQHTFWKGEAPDVRYAQYEEGIMEVRTALLQRGVNVMSLTPFVSLSRPDADFQRLCEDLERPSFIENEDITSHAR